MKKYALNCLLLGLCVNLNAAMIIPYDDLGDLTFHSDDIVIAHVTKDLYKSSNEMNPYSWELKIKKSFKGHFQKNQLLELDAMSSRSDEFFHLVIGDIRLEVGQTYLLFLNQSENDQWRPMCMSYYCFKEDVFNNKSYWVPTIDALNMCLWKDSDPIFVLNKEVMNAQLDSYISSSYQNTWNEVKIQGDRDIYDFHPALLLPPSSCSFLNDGNTCNGITYDGIRWQAFPSNPVEIWLDTEQQTGIDSELLSENAIDEMTLEYGGLNIPFEGIYGTNYNPTCTNNNAASGNFTSFSAGINGGDNVLTIFNDPCGQIPDLNGCAGTLAIGGLYGYCTANDTYDNLNWMEATWGYVIVNNGAECLSDSDFEIMITHEYTHTMGLGHIDVSYGTANMNPSCCNSIGTLDKECVDYLYPVGGSTPVEWYDFTVEERPNYNLLNWSTASEINNDHFVVEYSKASLEIKAWKELARLEGAGDSHTINHYEFKDDINLGAQTYYRIKQVDVDGKSSYSDVLSVKREVEKNEFSIYPNPADHLLNVVGDLRNSQITIVDALGNSHRLNALNISEHLGRLDISHLPAGIYFLQVENYMDKSVHSFIKQ